MIEGRQSECHAQPPLPLHKKDSSAATQHFHWVDLQSLGYGSGTTICEASPEAMHTDSPAYAAYNRCQPVGGKESLNSNIAENTCLIRESLEDRHTQKVEEAYRRMRKQKLH